MRDFQAGWEHPRLKQLVVEASQALARLDADRLEELALSCQALNRSLGEGDLALLDESAHAALACEAREATGDLAVLGRVLEATRVNLEVMNRLRDLRAGRLEYRDGRPVPSTFGDSQAPGWPPTESRHGDN